MHRGRGVGVGRSEHGGGGEGGRGCGSENRSSKTVRSRARSRDRVGSTADGGRSAVNRAKVSSCGRAVSCGSSDPQWWRTELDLGSGKSFDDLHRSATRGAETKRVRFLGGGFRFGLRWSCA